MRKALWAIPVLFAFLLLTAGASGWRPVLSLAAPEFTPLAAVGENALTALESEEEPAPPPPPTAARAEPAQATGDRGEQMRPTRDAEFALVYGDWGAGGWTDVLAEPKEGADRLSQALLGDRVEVLDQVLEGGEEWSRVRLLDQRGVEGWVPNSHLHVPSPADSMLWDGINAPIPRLLVVRAPGIEVEGGPFLPFGALLAQVDEEGDGISLFLPDGRRVLVDAEEVRRETTPLSPREASEALKGFREIRFQEGGNTREALDAAGFIYLLARVTGITAPRSLDELRKVGRGVSLDDAEAGDVVFFSAFNKDVPWPVVLLDDGETFIAATPATGVGFGLVANMRNRKVLEVRRFRE